MTKMRSGLKFFQRPDPQFPLASPLSVFFTDKEQTLRIEHARGRSRSRLTAMMPLVGVVTDQGLVFTDKHRTLSEAFAQSSDRCLLKHSAVLTTVRL
jgi:hypothetical protein